MKRHVYFLILLILAFLSLPGCNIFSEVATESQAAAQTIASVAISSAPSRNSQAVHYPDEGEYDSQRMLELITQAVEKIKEAEWVVVTEKADANRWSPAVHAATYYHVPEGVIWICNLLDSETQEEADEPTWSYSSNRNRIKAIVDQVEQQGRSFDRRQHRKWQIDSDNGRSILDITLSQFEFDDGAPPGNRTKARYVFDLDEGYLLLLEHEFAAAVPGGGSASFFGYEYYDEVELPEAALVASGKKTRATPAEKSGDNSDPHHNEEKALNAYSEFLAGNITLSEDDMVKIAANQDENPLSNPQKYAILDINGDGISELLVGTGNIYILTYKNDNLSLWWSDRFWAGCSKILDNGNVLHFRPGAAPTHTNYIYLILDQDGAERESIRFAKYDGDEDGVYDYFVFEQEDDLSEEEWNQRTQPYLSVAEIEWQEYPK